MCCIHGSLSLCSVKAADINDQHKWLSALPLSFPLPSRLPSPLAALQGGDFEEAQLIAIRNMANETDGITWRSNAVRVMVLTTDAPFHTGVSRLGPLSLQGLGVIIKRD